MKLMIVMVASFIAGVESCYFDISTSLVLFAVAIGYSVTDKMLRPRCDFASLAHADCGPFGITGNNFNRNRQLVVGGGRRGDRDGI